MGRDQALTGTVALLGLSGYEADPLRVSRAAGYFAARGFRVVIAPEPDQKIERFCGTDAVRLAALEALFRIDDLKLVIGLRGGYGLSRILGRIDFAAVATSIRERGVHWVGQSDWTAFHLALFNATGAVSLAGPLAAADFGREDTDPFTERQFWDVIDGLPVAAEWDAVGPEVQCIGTLWGGNLAMVCSLIGTPYLPAVDQGILFLEDVNEPPYRVERMLLQLAEGGILARQQALVLGDFSGYKVTDYDQGYDIDAVIDYVRSKSAVPIVTGLPFGHGSRKLTLPVGARFSLRASAGRVRLTQDA